MDISVILTTARFGGLDILFSSMLAQEFDGDFEVVVCDEYYQERKDRLAHYIKPSVAAYWNDDPGLDDKFNVKHLPPKRPCAIYGRKIIHGSVELCGQRDTREIDIGIVSQ